MANKVLESTIRISGDLDVSVQRALDGVVSNIDALEAASRKATGAVGAVAGKISDQSKVLEIAKRKYASYVLEGKEGTEQAKKLANEIGQLSADLKKNKAALKAAEDAADKLADDMDDAGDSAGNLGKAAEKAKEGFTVMKAAAANLVSKGIELIISSCVEAVKSVYNLSESTREFREDMGKLETAWESAGQSTELATKTYREFYSVLGEEDRSVEAVNHLAKFVETEEDLAKWTNIATGVWGTFGDSLPIEGLTEAANETAKVGQVTGVLADSLNWAGVNQEDFQKYLDKCNDEQERSAYITEMLNDLYGDAADNYRENNASIIDARKATADYNDSLAEIGEAMEPITTSVQRGLAGLLSVAADLIQKIDLAGFADKITKAFKRMSPVIEKLITDAMPFVEEFLDGAMDSLEMVLPLLADLGADIFPLLADFTKDVLPPLMEIVQKILPVIGQIAQLILPKLSEVLLKILPVVGRILDVILPVIVNILGELLPMLDPILDLVLRLLNDVILPILPPLLELIQNLLPLIKPLLKVIMSALEPVVEVLAALAPILAEVIGFIAQVVGWVAEGLDWVVSFIFGDGPGEVAEAAAANGYATGGFTNGLSIAGEDPRYPTEAVISFNPAYRAQNLSYWARAGRMLGADASDFNLSGESGSGGGVNLGGITFAPNITITGRTDKSTIMEAIEAEYPEFIDMLEEYLMNRGVTVYA